MVRHEPGTLHVRNEATTRAPSPGSRRYSPDIDASSQRVHRAYGSRSSTPVGGRPSSQQSCASLRSSLTVALRMVNCVHAASEAPASPSPTQIDPGLHCLNGIRSRPFYTEALDALVCSYKPLHRSTPGRADSRAVGPPRAVSLEPFALSVYTAATTLIPNLGHVFFLGDLGEGVA